jgi:glycosyltransferase involved in cell wall biosynthesis
MRVLYIYDGDWPHRATRVRKETLALAEHGHTVHLLSRNTDRAPRIQHEAWMTVHRLPTFPGALNRPLNFPLFFNPIWVMAIVRAARKASADALVVEDLPLAPTAIAVAKMLDVPVVFDMGEVYPEFLRGLRLHSQPSLLDRVLRSPAAADILERWVLRHASATAVVSYESLARAVSRGANKEHLAIVGNTPEVPELLREKCPAPEPLRPFLDRPIILFVGIIIADRGVEEAVRAMAVVRDHYPDAVLVVVGGGSYEPVVRQAIAENSLEKNVHMVGWRPHDELAAYYQHADVGLLPFRSGGQIDYTLANKLFDYMGAGLPFVASDVPPMRRIVEETQAGVLVKPADPGDLARGMMELLSRAATERARMGQRGVTAVQERFNWQRDAARFVELVEGLVEPTNEAG